MSPEQIRDAISASAELQALVPDTFALADALSVGRKRLVPTEIGSGTVLATLGAIGLSGGQFLDMLVAIGESNRDVYWTMDLIKQGRLRIDLPATRAGLQGIGAAVPTLQPAVTALLGLGFEADPVGEFSVRQAIWSDDGKLLV